MIGFELLPSLFAGYFQVANVNCKPQTPTKVTVTAATLDVRYDFTKTKNQLAQMQIDTVSPYSHEENTYIGGLMNGEIEVQTNVSLAWAIEPASRTQCFWYGEINVHLEIDPTILVAREFPSGSCEHNAIAAHENKHIAVDRVIVKKYRKVMEGYLQKVVSSVGAYGPVSTAQAPRIKKEMTDYLEAAIKKVTATMYNDRRQSQQSIDTRAEYDRVSSVCK